MYSSNPKTERYLESIKRLESQINWNQIKTVLLDLMGIVFVFGFFYSASLFFKIKLLKNLAVIFSLLAILYLTIRRRTTNDTSIDAAKKLDSHFKTKELFLSLYEVCNYSKDLPPERKKELSNIITKQITKQIGLKVIDETEIEPLKLSQKRKRLLLFFYPITALVSAFLLYKVITTITVEQKFIASIKSIANQAGLTEKQKEKTEDLINTLAENPLTSQEVNSAVSELEVALNENQTKETQKENGLGKESARDNKNGDKNQSRNNKEDSVAGPTVATATPTATATLTPSSDVNNKQKNSKQNQEKKEDQKTDVQNSKPDKSNQEKSPQDKKSGGDGEGEGNQSNGKQSDQGKEEKQGQSKDGAGEKSDSKQESKQGQGQGKQQSEDQKNNGGGGNNSKNPQNESQKDQQKASSGSSNTGSDKLKNKLDELKKEIGKQQEEQSGSDKGSKGEKQQDKKDDKGDPKDQGKDGQNDGNQGNKKGDNQSQQASGADGKSGQAQQQKDDKGKGDKGESDKNDSKSNDSQNNKSIPNDQNKQQDKSSPATGGQDKSSNPSDKQKDNPQDKSTDKEIGKNDDKNKQSGNSASGSKGMSLPSDSVKTEEKIPQDGGNGEKPGVKTGFQDKNIESNEKEKLNLDSLDNKSGEVTKNQNPAKPKTDIKDLLLSKPETSNNKEKQRVPLEYKGIL